MKYFRITFWLIFTLVSNCFAGQTSNAVPVVFEDQTCADRNRFFTNIPDHTVSFSQGISKLIAAKPQLVMIGEIHESPAFDIESTLIQSMRTADPDLNCLFLEIPSDEANEKNGEFGGNLKNLDPNGLLVNLFTWQLDVKTAKDLGMRVFFVDNWDTPPGVAVPSPDGMNFRNHQMAQHIVGLIKSHNCGGGISINGKYHLINDSTTTGYKSLQTLIAAAGVPLKTINLQDVNWGENGSGTTPPIKSLTIFDAEWVWNRCGQTPYRAIERVVFSNDWFNGVPFQDLSSEASIKTAGHWDDFDFTFILP